jgi:hypothetical protein
MAWVHLLGRKFADVLNDPGFDLLLEWPYWNRFGRQGHCYYGCLNSRRYCISQSKRNGPDTMRNLARVFRDGNAIDQRIGPFYSNRKGQAGLLVAAWNGSQWLQMISPGTPDQPADGFAELVEKIRADRTFDPQPLHFDEFGHVSLADNRLQELEDVLNGICGRRDFDW